MGCQKMRNTNSSKQYKAVLICPALIFILVVVPLFIGSYVTKSYQTNFQNDVEELTRANEK